MVYTDAVWRAIGDTMLGGDTDERLLFHIISGSALVFSATGKTLMDVRSGELAGESRFMQPNECGSAATIVARDRVECLVTPFEAVQTLCSMDHLFSARFHRGLAIAVAGAPHEHCAQTCTSAMGFSQILISYPNALIRAPLVSSTCSVAYQ